MVAISDASATRRIVELTRRLNPSIYIIARTRYVSEVDPLYALGANDVIPEEFETSVEIFGRVLNRYFIPSNEIERHVNDIRKDGYEMFRDIQQKYPVFPELKHHLPDIEVETIRMSENSPLAGKTLSDVGFRRKYGVTVLAIQRGTPTMTNPSADTRILGQDIIVLIGTRKDIAGLTSVTLSPGR